MANIGEQIHEARKRAGMTQETLARAVNVSRQTISHWEVGRAMPDAEMLLKLSEQLGVSFWTQTETSELQAATLPAPPQAGPASQAEAAPAAEPAPASVSAKLRRHWVALAAVLLCAALVAGFFGFRASRPRVYVANNGKSYTVEQFQQAAPRQEGRTWLSVEKIVRTQSGAEKGVNMYELIFHEMNGVGRDPEDLQADHRGRQGLLCPAVRQDRGHHLQEVRQADQGDAEP